MNVIELCGIRRSGIHAIAFWILERLPRSILVNNADCRRDNMYEVFFSHNDMRLLANFEMSQHLGQKDNLLVVREDQSLDEVQRNKLWFIDGEIDNRVIVLRDHYNTLASRWAAYVKKEQAEPTVVGDRFLELYLQYTREIQGATSYLPGTTFISYNRWLDEEDYRMQLLTKLNLQKSPELLGYLTRFGSSFSHNLSVDSLSTRWKHFENDEIFRTYASDPDLVTATKDLFNIDLPPSLRCEGVDSVKKLSRPEPIDSKVVTTKSRAKSIMVFSAFKTASRAMEAILRRSLPNEQFEILHKHNQSLHNLDYDILITTVRPHGDIFKSAYFQDITTASGYPYSLCLGMSKDPVGDYSSRNDSEGARLKRQKVLTTPVEKMVELFLSFPWHTYPWLNLNETLRWIRIGHEPFLTPHLHPSGYQIVDATKVSTGKPVKILFINSKLLRDIAITKDILSELGLCLSINKSPSVNEGRSKWYGEIYEKFLTLVPDEFNRQYGHLDEAFQH